MYSSKSLFIAIQGEAITLLQANPSAEERELLLWLEQQCAQIAAFDDSQPRTAGRRELPPQRELDRYAKDALSLLKEKKEHVGAKTSRLFEKFMAACTPPMPPFAASAA